MKYIAQLLGFSAIGISLFVYSRKKREKILIFKLIQDLLWSAHYLLLGTYPAMATNLICASREITFNAKNPRLSKNHILTYAYVIFYLLSAILTWKNAFSIFPALSSIITTIAFRLKDPIKLKLLAIPSSLCTLVYNITTSHSISVYVGVTITLTTLFTSLASTVIEKKRKKVNQDEKG